jgi:tetratricopeptide (TPR) repeat protein
MTPVMLLLLGALPPPDYEASLLEAAEARTDYLLSKNRTERAARYIENFRQHIADDARLTYEHGLTLRLIGEFEQALVLLQSAIAQDPTLAQAWYDLGEVQLLLGQKIEALLSFERAAGLSEKHPNGWAAPFRLAELAGTNGEIAAFESWLEKAIRRGFSFESTVRGNATWGAFLQDEALGDIMRRLITVYENEALLEDWQAP